MDRVGPRGQAPRLSLLRPPYRMGAVIEIRTVEQLLHHGYTVTVWCPRCKYRGPELDLARYCRQGRGGMAPFELGLRHARCRSPLELTIHPPRGYGKL